MELVRSLLTGIPSFCQLRTPLEKNGRLCAKGQQTLIRRLRCETAEEILYRPRACVTLRHQQMLENIDRNSEDADSLALTKYIKDSLATMYAGEYTDLFAL